MKTVLVYFFTTFVLSFRTVLGKVGRICEGVYSSRVNTVCTKTSYFDLRNVYNACAYIFAV